MPGTVVSTIYAVTYLILLTTCEVGMVQSPFTEEDPTQGGELTCPKAHSLTRGSSESTLTPWARDPQPQNY